MSGARGCKQEQLPEGALRSRGAGAGSRQSIADLMQLVDEASRPPQPGWMLPASLPRLTASPAPRP